MNYLSTQNLLRRTAVACAAASCFLLPGVASAASVTLNGATGQSCTYSGMSIAPDGTVTVSCAQQSGPPVVTLSAPLTMVENTTSTLTITRSSATGGDIGIPVSVNGCYTSGSVALQNGALTGTFTVTSLAAGSTCNVTLGNPVPSGIANLGTPSTAAISVTTATPTSGGGGGTGTGGGGSTITPPPGCATPPSSTTMATLPEPNGAYILQRAASGQILSFPLKNLSSINKVMEQIAFGETPLAGTPAPYTLNASFAPCPGIITAPSSYADLCNFANVTATNGATFQWSNSLSMATAYGVCNMPDSPQGYFNVQWTYTGACSDGKPTCGFSINTTTN